MKEVAMNRSSRTGLVLLLLGMLSAAAVIFVASRTSAARRSSRLHDTTINTIRRLGVAVMYDDQQRRQGTSLNNLGLQPARRDSRF